MGTEPAAGGREGGLFTWRVNKSLSLPGGYWYRVSSGQMSSEENLADKARFRKVDRGKFALNA